MPGSREAAPPRAEIKSLTGLRAVAASWVVLYHFQAQLAPITDQMPFLKPVLTAGWTGVELFFVLSGFVIARSYLHECGPRFRPRTALRFLFNRFARVWPAYAVATLAACGWMLVAAWRGVDTDINAPHPALGIMSLLRQLTMTQMWHRSSLVGASYDPPAWSISAEWSAYLCFPLIALVAWRLRRLSGWVNLALSVLATAPLVVPAFEVGPNNVEVSWTVRIACCFVAGVLASLAVRDLEGRGPRTESFGLFVATVSAVAALLLCFWNSWRRAGDYGIDFVGVATVLYPLLIVGLTLSERGPARFLARPPLVYGGRISYCLYLVHFVVQDVVVTYLYRNPAHRGFMSPGLALAGPVLLLVAGLLAAALHHGVEEPARKALLRAWRRVMGEERVRQTPPATVDPVHLPLPAVSPDAGTGEWHPARPGSTTERLTPVSVPGARLPETRLPRHAAGRSVPRPPAHRSPVVGPPASRSLPVRDEV